ncbi:winged helix-turn-helix transcriptional regulator [Streptomyces sp. SBT349]|uniref:winged helix-turn-helix transcriptional regulator n=1 Tax=Streptomyces sp. SBT349 TaxID=1580539 RepID=UPI00066C9509|nr:helix-turn-helix domain-containing protein [Streptomyces sp. SBT349]
MRRLSPETFDELCPSSMLPIRMQNKWAPLIMRLLGEGAQPFGELRRALPRTSPKELTRALRSLERDGFITRDTDADSPGYSLTPLGHSLLAVLLDVYAWTAEHWDELIDARERADREENGPPVNNVLTRNT